MKKTEESSSKIETIPATDGSFRSSRLPMGPILAASRFMSYLTKQPRHLASRRNYTISFNSNDKVSLSKQMSSSGHRRLSTTSDPDSSSTEHNRKTTSSKTVTTSTTPTTPTPDTVGLDFNFDPTYQQLRELAETNRQHFSKQNTDISRKFEHVLTELLNSIDLSKPLIRYLTDNFHHFDYSPEVEIIDYLSSFFYYDI